MITHTKPKNTLPKHRPYTQRYPVRRCRILKSPTLMCLETQEWMRILETTPEELRTQHAIMLPPMDADELKAIIEIVKKRTVYLSICVSSGRVAEYLKREDFIKFTFPIGNALELVFGLPLHNVHKIILISAESNADVIENGHQPWHRDPGMEESISVGVYLTHTTTNDGPMEFRSGLMPVGPPGTRFIFDAVGQHRGRSNTGSSNRQLILFVFKASD